MEFNGSYITCSMLITWYLDMQNLMGSNKQSNSSNSIRFFISPTWWTLGSWAIVLVRYKEHFRKLVEWDPINILMFEKRNCFKEIYICYIILISLKLSENCLEVSKIILLFTSTHKEEVYYFCYKMWSSPTNDSMIFLG